MGVIACLEVDCEAGGASIIERSFAMNRNGF